MLLIALFSYLISAVSATSNTSSFAKDTVSIYWGQNSIGYISNFKNTEKELWYYCNWDNVDVILLAFMNSFPGNYSQKHNMNIPTIFFPHHNDEEFSVNNTKVMKSLERDIKYCQKKNKKIFLSLGGQAGTYGFNSTTQAVEFGDTLWDMFGEGKNKSIPRPFGDAVIDGFDFDIENQNTVGYVDLLSQLKNNTDNGKRSYYFSAAPQCPYPEVSMDGILTQSHLDMVFVQFYNNKCNADITGGFNWDTWSNYATQTSQNKNVLLFLGLPGSVNSSSTGYIGNTLALTTIIDSVKNDKSFGGVMIWEASLAFQNKLTDSKKSFPQTIKNILLKEVDNKSVSGCIRLQAKTTSFFLTIFVAVMLLVI